MQPVSEGPDATPPARQRFQESFRLPLKKPPCPRPKTEICGSMSMVPGPTSKLRPTGSELPNPGGSSAFLTLAVVVVVIAGLYLGRQILVPIALATLLSFALAPLVRWLRRWRIPNVAAVMAGGPPSLFIILGGRERGGLGERGEVGGGRVI